MIGGEDKGELFSVATLMLSIGDGGVNLVISGLLPGTI